MIVAKGTRAVEAGVLNTTIRGAMVVSAKGSRTDSADTTWTETVGAKTQLEAKNITIEQEINIDPAGRPVIDADRFSQCLLNLFEAECLPYRHAQTPCLLRCRDVVAR